MKGDGIVPDGYWQITRTNEGQSTTAAFFLELQRANRSRVALASKLERYHRLYRSGRYEQLFGTPALRVLFVFTSDTEVAAPTRVRAGLVEAKRVGATFARFTTLEAITGLPPTGVLTASIWQAPARDDPMALFEG